MKWRDLLRTGSSSSLPREWMGCLLRTLLEEVAPSLDRTLITWTTGEVIRRAIPRRHWENLYCLKELGPNKFNSLVSSNATSEKEVPRSLYASLRARGRHKTEVVVAPVDFKNHKGSAIVVERRRIRRLDACPRCSQAEGLKRRVVASPVRALNASPGKRYAARGNLITV